jgi:hypothetical protein
MGKKNWIIIREIKNKTKQKPMRKWIKMKYVHKIRRTELWINVSDTLYSMLKYYIQVMI